MDLACHSIMRPEFISTDSAFGFASFWRPDPGVCTELYGAGNTATELRFQVGGSLERYHPGMKMRRGPLMFDIAGFLGGGGGSTEGDSECNLKYLSKHIQVTEVRFLRDSHKLSCFHSRSAQPIHLAVLLILRPLKGLKLLYKMKYQILVLA